MVKASMQDFLQSGQLGPIRLGMSRTQVRELLGDPDDIGGTSRKYRVPATWKYGDIELHYERGKDQLVLIHADDFNVLSGGRAIDLDPWIIRGGVSLEEVQAQLQAVHIAYQFKEWPYGDNVIVLNVGRYVQLSFLHSPEPSNSRRTGLYSISCSEQL